MNPLVHAFFVGRVLAQALNEQVEKTLTNALSELGKFDAEQREYLRQFTQEVIERVHRETESIRQQSSTSASGATQSEPADLQATIDELRAEIAQLRAELQRYRSRSL